jgi:MoxR-like ATPase
VLATQNPIEHEGTYTLPEAELDRFLLKLLVRYPRAEEELQVLSFYKGAGNAQRNAALPKIMGADTIRALRAAAETVHVDDRIAKYMVSVVGATRPAPSKTASHAEGMYKYIAFGASPRASIALYRCSRIHALFENRKFVAPDDVKAVAFPVLRHRLVLSYEAEADGLDSDTVIDRILSLVQVP